MNGSLPQGYGFERRDLCKQTDLCSRSAVMAALRPWEVARCLFYHFCEMYRIRQNSQHGHEDYVDDEDEAEILGCQCDPLSGYVNRIEVNLIQGEQNQTLCLSLAI